MTWVNLVVQGVFLGGVYALLACGLSLMFGVMRIINLAHGDIAVVGAYAVWVVCDQFDVDPWVGLVVALPLMLIVGYLLQVTLLNRSLGFGELVPLLTTFGLAIIIQNLLLQIFSPDVHSLGPYAGSAATASWHITDQLSIPVIGVITLGCAFLVLGGLQLLLARTGFGRSMRATAQDPDTAALIGVNPKVVYAQATAIAVATATLAGTFFGIRAVFDPSSGSSALIFAFEAVIIGGMGSLWGTLWGGIVLGVAQAVGGHIDPQYAILTGHLVFLLVLILPRSRAALGVSTP